MTSNEKAARAESGGSSITDLIEQPCSNGCCQFTLANTSIIGTLYLALVSRPSKAAVPDSTRARGDGHTSQ